MNEKPVEMDIFTALFKLYEIKQEQVEAITTSKDKLELFAEKELHKLRDFSSCYDEIVSRYYVDVKKILNEKK